jgi:hypothetical protein
MSGAEIGIDKAARILYYAQTNLLNRNEDYFALRSHTLAAAAILYGLCSNEYNAVNRAWWVVNIGSGWPCATTTWHNSNGLSPQTGINKVAFKSPEIDFYPNPAYDKVTITSENTYTNDYQIKIYNLDGKVVAAYHTKNIHDFQIDISHLSPGIYPIHISTSAWNKVIRFVKI